MTDKLYHECHELISQSRIILEDLKEWGYDTIIPVASPVTCVNETVGSPSSECVNQVSQILSLEHLEQSIQGCSLCSLSQERKSIVFGAGNPRADLVLVGEAPGREEDIKGSPFVGEAGQLLDKILFAMRLTREDVYICNVIKCRPPQSRDPQPSEIASCEPFLKQQLVAIKPKMILSLGRFATQTLLQTKDPISRLRGQWHEYEGIALMPTFHPAYLLKNLSSKREVWEDVKKVISKLNH
jgi:uracil-DNA glycosylase